MNRQISFFISFVVGLIFMIIPEFMTPSIQFYLFEDFFEDFVVGFVMVWLGFLSVVVFGLAILYEGIRNIIK